MRKKNEDLFSTSHLEKNLKVRAVRSAGTTAVAQLIKLCLQLLSMAIMARILAPSDFGLVAMVAIFTGLAVQLMDGGLSMATIQREEITHDQVSNLFWINAALGLALYVLAICLAPVIAWVYKEPRLVSIMAIMSLMFVIGGLSVQHNAILRRRMQFRVIAVVDVVSIFLGLVVGVFAAMQGMGYWSLVLMPIVNFTSQTLLRWCYVGWMPGWMKRGTGVRPLVGFGAELTGANIVGYITTNVTPFVVGLVGGAKYIGLYDRANTIALIPSKKLLLPVMNVMQSALTRVSDSQERLRIAAVSLLSKIALLTMFVTITMFVTADWLVDIILGDGWEESVVIFRILSLGTIVTPITTFVAIVLVSKGEARALMHWKLITLFILLISVAVGSYWGVVGVVVAHGISGIFIRVPLFLAYSTRFQPVKISDYAWALLPPLLCASFTLAILFLLRGFFDPDNPFIGVLAYGFISLAIYFVVCLCLKTTRNEIVDGINLVMLLWDRRKTPS